MMACSYLNFYQYFFHFELLGQQYYKNESIYLNSWHYSQKKQKGSPETQLYLLIFSPELETAGVALQRIHQNSKKW